jgi:hypothetical protein
MYNSATVPAVSDGILNLNPTGSGVDVKLINNTIAYNSSARTTSGGTPGLYVRGTANLTTLKNNILFSNFDTQGTPVSTSIGSSALLKESRNNITDVAYNWTAKTTDGATNASGNAASVTNSTLLLVSTLAANGGATKTLAINVGSSAINNGFVSGAPTVDQRNLGRVGTVDVGAYEYSGTTDVSEKRTEKVGLQYINEILTATGTKAGQMIEVYNTTGQKITSVLASEGITQFPLSGKGIMIIRIDAFVQKLLISK